MDRFEILKYSILLEEHFKTLIIEKILGYGVENSFDSIESYENLLLSIEYKLKKFGKPNKGMKNKIFHCSAKELILVFQLLKFSIRKEIAQESSLSELLVSINKYKTVLTGNKLVRDICAHPTYNLEKTLSKLTVFTFMEDDKSGLERIQHFYEYVKNNI